QPADNLLGHAARFDDLYFAVNRVLAPAAEFGQQIPLAALGSLDLQRGKGFIYRFDTEGVDCRSQKYCQKHGEEDLAAEHDNAEVLADVNVAGLDKLRFIRGHIRSVSNFGLRSLN